MSDQIRKRQQMPSLDFYPHVTPPAVPTWEDVVRLSYHEPVLRYAVTLASMPYSNISREQALIGAVFALYNAKAAKFRNDVDRLNRAIPDFVMVGGKRYERCENSEE